MRKILAYGFPLEGNFGAPSVVHGLRELLRHVCPDAEFVYYNRGALDEYCACDMDFKVRVNPYEGCPYRLFRDYVAVRWFGLRPHNPAKLEFWEDFLSSDAVVYAYAICFHYKQLDAPVARPLLSAVRRALNFTGLSLLARVTGRRSVKSTSSYGPMPYPYYKWLARISSRFFSVMVARERESECAMREQAGVRKSIFIAPDVANLMPAGDASAVPGRVGFAISFQIVNQWKGAAEDYVECMRELVRHVCSHGNREVVLIPNQYAHTSGANDEDVARRILDGVGGKVRIVDASHCGARTVKSEIASCEFLVSSRYHASVAGFSAGVPELIVGWHHKYTELAELYGQLEWVMRTEDCSVAAVIDAFDRAWGRRDELRRTLRSRILPVRDRVIASGCQMFGEVKP